MLQRIEFTEDSKLQTIDEGAFRWSMIECITIPGEVTIIGNHAFSNCKKLRRIEFANESKLQTIESLAFDGSSIESITIPSRLIELEKGWCRNTPNLTNVSVSKNNSRYMCVDGKMVVGKRNINKSHLLNIKFYDIIIFSFICDNFYL